MSDQPNSRKDHIGVWLALWALCTGLSFCLWARPKTTPLQEDEIYWIGSAYYYDLAVAHPDWGSPDWQLLPARENPPVAKYLIGLGLAATGQHVTSPDLLGCFYALFQSIPGAWGTGPDYAKRAAVVARMAPSFRDQLLHSAQLTLPESLLTPPRVVMIGCSILTSLLVLLFARCDLSAPAGLLASQALLMHPVVVDAYNHAMSDAVALLFSTAAAVATFYWLRVSLAAGQTRLVRGSLSVLVGGLLAFACGAKMNSLVVVVLAGGMIAAAAGQAGLRSGRAGALSVLGFGAGIIAIAAIVFIAINPTILHDVTGGLAATVTEHRQTEIIQVKFLHGHLEDWGQKFTAVAQLALFSRIACGALALYALIGLASDRAGVRFIGAWWLIAWFCVSLWIPFSRLRYVMPLIAPTVLLGASFADKIARGVSARIRQLRQATRPEAEVF